ncbi:MAG: hypothetical protein LBS50_00365 [Prevotellaceae bacterium]|jgi:hypothetical protein|nr:hypothetical protein [Prevotellaceae bacterium]
MTIWEAIKEMRIMSQKKQYFSFAFMSFSAEKQKSDGIVRVSKALLTRRERTETNKYAEHFLSYYDYKLMEARHFWQPLLVEFNGQNLELK